MKWNKKNTILHFPQVLEGGDIGQIQKLAANSDDPFYAMEYLI